MVVILAGLLLHAPQGDSTAVRRHARQSQAEFEWHRKSRLPFVAVRRAGECDARIGRFCYWHDDSPTDSQPEPIAIGEARDRLIRVLDSAARAYPGDEWLAGQRVRYLLERGMSGPALEAARDCRAARWWCAALEGLVRHGSGDFAGADSAYRIALDGMPAAERCRWTDLTPLLDEPLRNRYRRLACAERQDFETRLWWLAQPFLSRPVNDRRTEHFARLTMARLLRHAASPYGAAGGDDLTELIVRYGWPANWGQEFSEMGRASLAAGRVVVGNEREPAYHFVPAAAAFDGTTSSPESDPVLRDARPPERYAPSYAATFTTLAPEFATFQHADSTLVVGTYDLSHDSLFQGQPTEAALVLARDERTAPVVERQADPEGVGVLVAAAPWVPRVLSLEVVAPARRRAARVRVAPRSREGRSRVSISDLLLFEPADSLPQNLAAALPRTRRAVVAPGSRVGLYWETYGLDGAGEALATVVSVVPERIGWLRRAAETLRLAARPRLVRLAWSERGLPRDGIASRSLVVDLSSLAAGRYRLEVAVQPRDQAPVTASRAIRITAP